MLGVRSTAENNLSTHQVKPFLPRRLVDGLLALQWPWGCDTARPMPQQPSAYPAR
jgi:hypothetical protein